MTITIQMSDFNEFFLTNHFRPEEAEFLGRPTRIIAWLRIELLLESLLEAHFMLQSLLPKILFTSFFWGQELDFNLTGGHHVLWRTLQSPTFSKMGYFTTSGVTSLRWSFFNEFPFPSNSIWAPRHYVKPLKWLIIWVVFWSQRGSPVVSPAEVANCFRGF